MPTRRSRSFARASRLAAVLFGSCARITSSSWVETLCTGLSEFIAPWNTIDVSAHRNSRSFAGLSVSTSTGGPSAGW